MKVVNTAIMVTVSENTIPVVLLPPVVFILHHRFLCCKSECTMWGLNEKIKIYKYICTGEDRSRRPLVKFIVGPLFLQQFIFFML